MITEYRTLTLLGAQDGALRTAVFRGTEHMVIPVIALVEGVVHAVNSPHAELVLAEEMSRAPSAWNGEPVMYNHPDRNGEKISANSPEVLEALQLGQVFNTRMDGDRLRMDAYVDPSRADKVGEGARRLLDILQSGGVVEVSVGAFVNAEKKTGVFKGKTYKAVWRDIVPDHLALLPEGVEGACSAKAGCGAGTPRANAGVHLVTAAGIEHVEQEGITPMADNGKPEGKSLRDRVRDMIKSLQSSKSTVVSAAETPEGTSDADLRRALDSALRSTEPAYQGIDAVFPTDLSVVYAVAPDEKLQIIMRSYSVTDGTVSLGDDRTEVEPVMRYEPVTAAEAAPKAASCGCHKKVNDSAVGAPAEEPRTMHKNAERITSLIANPKTPFNEADRAHLETQPDERISALEAQFTEPVPPSAPAITLDQLPDAWRKAIEAQAAQEAAARSTAIDALAASQTVFSKADLEAMPVDQLTKIATLAGTTQTAPPPPVTFAGRAPVVRANSSEREAPPAPPSYNDSIKAAAAARR